MNVVAMEKTLPNPVDLHVGGRIRLRRKVLGVSQERLAESLGLAAAYLDAYLDGCALRGDPKGPLFRTIERGGRF